MRNKTASNDEKRPPAQQGSELDYITPGLRTLAVPIDSIKPDPANARKHGERNRAVIAGSLNRFGQQKPVVCDSKGVIRAGNGTWQEAKSLGWTHIAAVMSDLPLRDITAYAIADNRAGELAEWDTEVLAGALSDPELGDVGFDEGEIAAMEMPDFSPVGIDEQGRLDEKKKCTCPECGHEFTP